MKARELRLQSTVTHPGGQAADEIVASCQMLHAAPKDVPGKARLLTACKDILRETTLLLQMTGAPSCAVILLQMPLLK